MKKQAVCQRGHVSKSTKIFLKNKNKKDTSWVGPWVSAPTEGDVCVGDGGLWHGSFLNEKLSARPFHPTKKLIVSFFHTAASFILKEFLVK